MSYLCNMFYTYLECVMFMRKDITDLNPNENLHQMANELAHYMVNDLIFTSAGELDRVVVEKTGGKTWEQWDIDPFDPVPYGNADVITNTGDDTGVADDDEFHGDNVSW